MPALSGKGGSVKIGAAVVASVQSWKVDVSAKMDDASALGDSWESSQPNLLSWSGSLELLYAMDTDTAGQTALRTAFLTCASVALKLCTDATHFYSGAAFMNKMGIDVPKDANIKGSFDFTGSGALTPT
jgi:hypothetical protein